MNTWRMAKTEPAAYVALYPNANRTHAESQFRRIMDKQRVKAYYEERQEELSKKAKERHALDFDEMILSYRLLGENFVRLQELAAKAGKQRLSRKEVEEFKILEKAAQPQSWNRAIEILGRLLVVLKKTMNRKAPPL
jgi:hypothetical protein